MTSTARGWACRTGRCSCRRVGAAAGRQHCGRGGQGWRQQLLSGSDLSAKHWFHNNSVSIVRTRSTCTTTAAELQDYLSLNIPTAEGTRTAPLVIAGQGCHCHVKTRMGLCCWCCCVLADTGLAWITAAAAALTWRRSCRSLTTAVMGQNFMTPTSCRCGRVGSAGGI